MALKSDRIEDFKWRGRIEMAVWSGSDRERNMSRKMGGEDETAAASSVLHKAEGRRLSLSLSLSLPLSSHDSYEKQGLKCVL